MCFSVLLQLTGTVLGIYLLLCESLDRLVDHLAAAEKSAYSVLFDPSKAKQAGASCATGTGYHIHCFWRQPS